MRVGIIGCGGIASSHIEAYKNLTNAEVVSLCDLDLTRANSVASVFKIQKTYSDYKVMLEKEHLDLVDVCTPVSTHATVVCDVAEDVPAILLEKPMAMDVSECDKMINALKKHGSNLCVGHSQLFSPLIQKADSIVNSGNFDLQSFRTTLKANFETLRSFNLAPAWNVLPAQKGILWEVCCHHAYLQLHFLPEISEVFAVGRKTKYSVFDDFGILLRGKDNRFGFIEISWICPEVSVIYELQSARGRRLHINWEFDYIAEFSEPPPYTKKSVIKNMLVDDTRLFKKWYQFFSCYAKKRKLLPVRNLISSYVNSIEKDLPSPVSAEDGRATIRLLESIERSLIEQRPISVK